MTEISQSGEFFSGEPVIPEGVEGTLGVNDNGHWYVRNTLEGKGGLPWVHYRYFDEDGVLGNGVIIPGFEIFTQEDIARLDEQFGETAA